MSQTFTVEEVAQHNKAEDCWIIIEGKVYNVTKFLSSHPGGKKPILNLAGKDATKEFHSFHNVADVLSKYGPELLIGSVGAAKQAAAPSSSPSKKEFVPYGDPTWYQEWRTTYYNESHKKFRAAVRAFVEKELMPFCHEWDEAKRIPKEVWGKAYEAGILPACIGPPFPTQYVPASKLPGGIKPEEFDRWHEFILLDELARCGSGGVLWGLVEGLSIGLPPVLLFGSKYLQDKVATDCLTGKKMICLGVTEPAAGSDVASITTTAKKSPCGKFYIVNGEKKFITNGIWADYFTTAVRTGGPGNSGISFLLIERNMPGVSTRPMNMSGVWASGTTYITFEDVKVPVENLIGKENDGFKYIMHNFNHERWALVVQTNRFARVCFEEAFKYAHKRKTFGQRLVDHPVIRLKLAHMARQIEGTHHWLENVTLQLNQMSHEEAMQKLSGPIGLLKAHSTFVFEYCAREAFQIFGGLAYTRGSQGEKVERLYRDVRAYAIGGGSEEILLDLGIRQAMKFAKL